MDVVYLPTHGRVVDGEAAAAVLLRVASHLRGRRDLPTLLDGTEGYTLRAGATMVVTFQVVVDDPLSGGITEIVNTATSKPPTDYNRSVGHRRRRRAGVVVEYDNAGFDFAGATVSYFHEVNNTGSTDDSYAITLASELDWLVELIDPSTGAVIATDSSGDGNSLWDNGVTINTGTLAPGEAAQYQLRVTIPGGAGDGVSESTSRIATSERVASVFAQATDETYTVTALEPVILLPDNSGVAEIGGTAVYSHRILNNTGVPDTFDLSGWSENGWGFTFYWDTDGNGIYTDGVDVAITNTLQLADGASQLFFVVVDVPGSGVADNTVDVVHIGAVSRNNVWDDGEQKWDVYNSSSATDTTTVTPPTILDLSGGGTRTVLGGGIAVFPGPFATSPVSRTPITSPSRRPGSTDSMHSITRPSCGWTPPEMAFPIPRSRRMTRAMAPGTRWSIRTAISTVCRISRWPPATRLPTCCGAPLIRYRTRCAIR